MFSFISMLISMICLVTSLVVPSDELTLRKTGKNVYVNNIVRQGRSVVVPDDIEDLLHPGVKKAFIHTHGDDAGEKSDIIGFSKEMNSKGNDGYKHFDSYHKKDANKYGFEIFSKFGKAEKASVDTTKENEEDLSKKEADYP